MDQTYPTPIIHIKHIGNFTFGPVIIVMCVIHSLILLSGANKIEMASDQSQMILKEAFEHLINLV